MPSDRQSQSSDVAPFNFTGGVSISPGSQWQWGRNALADFGHTYMRGQARMKDPLFNLREMMMQQSINKNALDIGGTYNKRNLEVKARLGAQKISQVLATNRFDDENTIRQVYSIAAEHGLTLDDLRPITDRFQSAMEFRNRMGLLDRAQELKLQHSELTFKREQEGPKIFPSLNAEVKRTCNFAPGNLSFTFLLNPRRTRIRRGGHPTNYF